MMLRDPFMDRNFEPDLMWFIGVFDVYDREETRGEELEVFNPNNQVERETLIVRYSLKLGCLSYRHKFVLFEFLAEKIRDRSYDFEILFNIDDVYDSSWPRAEWYALTDPRGFFEDVYRLAREEWKDDLHKASLEDQSTW
jgi:hypothetical protein